MNNTESHIKIDENSKITGIIDLLKYKACTKQKVYTDIKEVFKKMKKIASDLANEVDSRIQAVDTTVDVDYINVSEFEFQIKFSGDIIVFSMHSNVVTFPEKHILHKSPYIQEDPKRKFFGAIVVYNFLADSLRYKRMADPGYLLGRLFVNNELHYSVEGVRQMSFLYPDIAKNILSDMILQQFIESAMVASLEIDSEMPPFEKERVINVHHKLRKNMLGNIQKVGFKMSS